MLEVDARLLPPPQVLYANGKGAEVADGNWNLRGKRVRPSQTERHPCAHSSLQFVKNGPRPLQSWAMVSFDKYTNFDDMKRYITYLVGTMQAHGVVVQLPTPPLIPPRDPRQLSTVKATLQEAALEAYKATGCDPQLICVVLPGR